MATRIAIGRRRARRRGASVQKNWLRDHTPKDGEHAARTLITNVGSEGDGAGRGGCRSALRDCEELVRPRAVLMEKWSLVQVERLTLLETADCRLSSEARAQWRRKERAVRCSLVPWALAGPCPNSPSVMALGPLGPHLPRSALLF